MELYKQYEKIIHREMKTNIVHPDAYNYAKWLEAELATTKKLLGAAREWMVDSGHQDFCLDHRLIEKNVCLCELSFLLTKLGNTK